MGLVAATSLAISTLLTSLAWADARSDYLVRLLTTSDAFRVRAQAALSLGQLYASGPVDGVVTEALRGALRDENASVRGAAVSALGRSGQLSIIGALRPLQRDPEPAVQRSATEAIAAIEANARTQAAVRASAGVVQPPPNLGPARYYVGIGMPGSKVQLPGTALARARTFLERTLGQTPGMLVAPAIEAPSAASQVMRSRGLQGFYLDSSIVSLAPRADGALRAEVSVIVLSYPERNMRTFLTGGGAIMGATGPEAEQQAIEAAYASALRNLEAAFAASASPAAPPPRRGRRR